MKPKEMLDRWVAGQCEPPPVARLVGVELVRHGEAVGTVALAAGQRHHNAMGTVHGGILCDLADVAMGIAMATVLEDEESFTTLGLQISFFRPVRDGRLIATGRTVRRGRTTSYCECEIVDERDTLIAKATSTCLILSTADAPSAG